VETQAALVGTDRAVHLDPIAAVDVDLTGVVLPGDAKDDHALGLDQTLQDFGVTVLRVQVENRLMVSKTSPTAGGIRFRAGRGFAGES